MRIPRLHLLQPLPLEQTITLEAAASHYVGKVLRMQEKQEIILFNDLSEQVSAHIVSLSKKSVSVFVSAPVAGPPPLRYIPIWAKLCHVVNAWILLFKKPLNLE